MFMACAIESLMHGPAIGQQYATQISAVHPCQHVNWWTLFGDGFESSHGDSFGPISCAASRCSV
jgi:hypothetical protein